MQVELNGGRIHYELSGIDDGPIVAMSHSLGSSLRMWDFQMTALEGRYRVLRYDTRGHGDSAPRPGAYSLDDLGDDALALLDHLEFERVHWLGLSLGGMIGQNLGLRAPSRIATLMLCDTSATLPGGAREAWKERIAAVEKNGMSVLTQATMERWFTAPYLATAPAAVNLIRDEFESTPPAGFIGCCHAIQGLDYLDRLAEIRTPTLVVVGEHDSGTPVAASEAISSRIQGSRLTVIPDAAHLSNVEQAGLFNDAIVEFLSEHA